LFSDIFAVHDIADCFAQALGAGVDIARFEVEAEFALLGLHHEAVEGGEYGEATAGHCFHGRDAEALAVRPHDEDIRCVFHGYDFFIFDIPETDDLFGERGSCCDELIDFLIEWAVPGHVESRIGEVGRDAVECVEYGDGVFSSVEATAPEEDGVSFKTAFLLAFLFVVRVVELNIVSGRDEDIF